MTGRAIKAEDALEIGLLGRVPEPEQLYMDVNLAEQQGGD